jgi:leucyl/phenylalanyl-tRNA---protein transferase
MIPWLEGDTPFPPVQRALQHPNGLLAAGGDLSPERLLAGYRRGIFPWFSEDDPILWWSPDPRMVLFPPQLKVARSLAKAMRNRPHQIRFDHAFAAVIAACAAPREGASGTWITERMRDAYERLHRLGHAHSVEVWIDGELAGGLYGVALGRVFFGESMFTRARDASKMALVALVGRCRSEGIELIDCQMHTPHLESLGAREIPRREFAGRLLELVHYPRAPGNWSGADAPTETCRN